MKLAKITILALFLSLLLIGTVSATSVTNDTQINSDINQIDENILQTENLNSNIEIKSKNIDLELATANNNEILTENTQITVNNYKQLYDQIENIKTQGTSKSYTINFNPKGDFTITDTIELEGEKSPARTFIFNGNGATIDGKNSKSFLTIFSGYTATVNNINFVNNFRNVGGGGALFVHTDGELNVNNCNFTNCRAINNSAEENIHAGAIRVGFDAKVNIQNSIFKKSAATFGGGAIVIGGTLTDYNTEPHPDLDPATITPKAYIKNCQFIENTAGHGGAINIEDFCAAVITNCIFKDNAAINQDDVLGGGICTDESSYLVSINNTFENNRAGESGGGIYNAPHSVMTIENNIFIKNQAQFGAAICNLDETRLTIKGSTFTENKAIDGGGAVHNTNNTALSISHSTFSKNTANNGGAISNLHNIKLTVSDCEFNNNLATENGGAIGIGEDSEISLANIKFNSNKAIMGGAVCVDVYSNLIADGLTFTGNTATRNGAGIYGAKNNNIQIKNSKLTQNTATENGGAISIGENTEITINNMTFTANKASMGGAICIDANSNFNANYGTFTGNIATTNGGAIYSANNNNIQIKNSKLTQNKATENGGAIGIGENNEISVNNIICTANKATMGGAICIDANTNLEADKITLSQNNATKNGGAIYGAKNNNMQIKNTEITQNIATKNGGAIGTGENTELTVSNTKFGLNKAVIGGAICMEVKTNLIMDGGSFTKNTASNNGGAIYATTINNILIKDAEITSNIATANGGAIYAGKNTDITATDVAFNTNKANMGGAICVDANTNITTDTTTFTKNTASKNGGAIYSTNNNNIQTKNTEITQNTATANGGAIYGGKYTDITSTSTAFNSNEAVLGGAICIDTNSKITTDKSAFTKNTASKNGGAIYSTNSNNLLVKNTKMIQNTATANGGAIYTGKTTSLTTSNTTFNKNKAGSFGGAICEDSQTKVVLSNSEFNDNTANAGNALYNPQEGTLTFKGTTYIDPEDYRNIGELKIEDTVNTKISIDSVEYSSGTVVEGRLVDEYNSPIPGERVSVSVENENIIANTDNNGNFIATFKNINPGTYRITATFNGHSVYNKATTSISKKVVNRQATKIKAEDMTTTFNAETYFTITLTNSQNSPLANTQITADLGTGANAYKTDNNGQVKISTKGLSANEYVATVIFDGDENYLKSNATAKITVNKQATKIETADVTTTYGTNKNMVITLKNGQNIPLTNTKITIDLGTGAKIHTTDNNGQVIISTDSLATKSYTVKIKYGGDENYAQSTATAKITINKIGTNIAAANITTTYNTNKDLIITLKDSQNKPLVDFTVTVTIGVLIKQYETDNNGQVKRPTNSLTPDTYYAKIKYGGDENYMKSNTVAKIKINKDTPKLTAKQNTNEILVSFTDSQNRPLAGMPLTINAGKGSKAYTTNSNGQVKLPNTEIAPNAKEVTIKYNGNEKYVAVNTTVKLPSTKQATKITAADVTTTYGTNKYLVITLTNIQNKPLQNTPITVDLGTGAKVYKTDNNGQVKISTNGLVPKTYTATITFNGDDTYAASSTTAKVTVTKEQAKIFLRNALYFVLQTKMVKLTLWDANNKPLAGKTVHITLNEYGLKYQGVTDENGEATIRVGVGFGVHSATVSFDGDENYTSNSKTGSIRVIKETPSLMLPGAYTKFKATDPTKTIKVYLKDRYNKPLLPGTKVFVKINGKQYVGSINNEGIASININLNKVGVYDVELYYTGNTAYNAVRKNTKISIV